MLSLFGKKTPKSASAKTVKPEVEPIETPAPVTYQEISLRAYQHWLARGGAHGYDHEDWFRAEQELALRN